MHDGCQRIRGVADPQMLRYGTKMNQGGGAPLRGASPVLATRMPKQSQRAGRHSSAGLWAGGFGSPMAPNAGEAVRGELLDVVSCMGLARRTNAGASTVTSAPTLNRPQRPRFGAEQRVLGLDALAWPTRSVPAHNDTSSTVTRTPTHAQSCTLLFAQTHAARACLNKSAATIFTFHHAPALVTYFAQ